MAQKVLRTSTDYKIESAGNVTISSTPGGTITIDPGAAGTAYVTGNLTVLGTTTTVDSTIVDVKDNIIVLNSGESGAGVSLVISGMEIDRGSLPKASLLWNENNLRWEFYNNSPLTLSPLKVESIELNAGSTVDNIDNDDTLAADSSTRIPTQHAVKTYVDNNVSAAANTIFQLDSSVTVHDSGVSSYVETIIDSGVVSRINTSGMYVDAVSAYSFDGNLTLSANGYGEIIINNVVNLPYQGDVPGAVASVNKVYAATPGSGGSGLYFVNDTASDELVSKTKAFVYAIIF